MATRCTESRNAGVAYWLEADIRHTLTYVCIAPESGPNRGARLMSAFDPKRTLNSRPWHDPPAVNNRLSNAAIHDRDPNTNSIVLTVAIPFSF